MKLESRLPAVVDVMVDVLPAFASTALGGGVRSQLWVHDPWGQGSGGRFISHGVGIRWGALVGLWHTGM